MERERHQYGPEPIRLFRSDFLEAFTHIHHFQLRGPALVFLRRHHMRHHAGSWNDRFGVSSPLWDYVFGTMPAK